MLELLCQWSEMRTEKVHGDKFEVLEEGVLNDHLK